ncbi:MAG TPA: hypothetical protein VGR28_12165 [Candidatus Thermoplasmatota archaeon]|jgi:hypothetical protein|nr:hypothetical protein [Candidatus Thermoplasmatota archaeon]
MAGDPAAEGGMPRWVKALVAVGAVLVVGFVALHLTGSAPVGH